jgi:hypothetical protein
MVNAVRNKDGKWGYIDGKNSCHPSPDSSWILKMVKLLYPWMKKGVIDKDGKYIINPQFGMLMQMETNI